MSYAGMAYRYRPQNQNTLPGTLNSTTRWRQLPFNNTNDTLSLLRFEDIAGEVIDVPNGVTVMEVQPNSPPVPAIQLGQRFLIEWMKSYEVRLSSAYVHIHNQRQQSVRTGGGAKVMRPAPLPIPVPQEQPAVDPAEEPIEEFAALQVTD